MAQRSIIEALHHNLLFFQGKFRLLDSSKFLCTPSRTILGMLMGFKRPLVRIQSLRPRKTGMISTCLSFLCQDRRTSGLLQFNPAARAARRSRGRPLVRIQSLGPCRVFITDLRYEHSTFFFSWSAVRWGGVFLSSGNRICGTGRLPQAPRGARLSPGKRLTFKINCAIMSLYAKRRESDGLDCLCRADQRSARPADSALTRSSFRLHGAPKRIS